MGCPWLCTPVHTSDVLSYLVLQVQLKPVPEGSFVSVSLEQGEFILRGSHLCWKCSRDLFFGLCKLNQLKPVEMIRVKLKITYNGNNGIPPLPFFFTENTAFLSENWNFTIELSTGSIKIKHSLLLYKHFI